MTKAPKRPPILRADPFPIPTYEQLERIRDDIVADLDELLRLWRWLLPSAFQRPRRGESEHVRGGSLADVADEVASTERFRMLLRRAASELRDARNRAHGAKCDAGEAMGLLEPRSSGPEVADERLLPHPASKADIRHAEQAQARRLARARATGDWDEAQGEPPRSVTR